MFYATLYLACCGICHPLSCVSGCECLWSRVCCVRLEQDWYPLLLLLSLLFYVECVACVASVCVVCALRVCPYAPACLWFEATSRTLLRCAKLRIGVCPSGASQNNRAATRAHPHSFDTLWQRRHRRVHISADFLNSLEGPINRAYRKSDIK